jgi:hypothetical protein
MEPFRKVTGIVALSTAVMWTRTRLSLRASSRIEPWLG